jgi:kynurenine formamidase
MLIRNPKHLNEEECSYAMNTATHLDFLIYNKINKKPVLTIEVDGFHYHKILIVNCQEKVYNENK